MKILIVDDSCQVREYLRELLEMHGHEVSESSSLTEAEAFLISRLFDAAVIDGMFPSRNHGDAAATTPVAHGPILCQRCRKLGIRSVLYSGEPDLVEYERKLGHQALLKPAPIAALLASVEQSGASRVA